MSTEIKKLDVSKLDVSNIEFSGFEELKAIQLEVVKNNPYVEILDNKTFDEAKKSRTALKLARTSVQNQDKLIASNLQGVRKLIKSKHDELIEIVSGHEEKQQIEVTRFEQIKENKLLEVERLENERIEKIKNKIEELENDSYTVINGWNSEILKTSKNSILSTMETDFDFEEFDILFQKAKLRVQEHSENKINSLTIQENQRLENERLSLEKADADAKLKAIQEQQEKERAEREEKERIEKEKVFEVRKNRLSEIGIIILNDFSFHHKDGYDVEFYKETIFNCDVIEFENILTDAKKLIQDAKKENERIQAKKEAQEKAESEAKKKAEKENKARVKRLSKDKAIYKKTLEECLTSFPAWFEADNVEIKEFSMEAKNRVVQLQNELLTELENL